MTAVIAERLAMYERVIAEGKVKGESSKVRRYTRALDTIKTMKKKVSALGICVNLCVQYRLRVVNWSTLMIFRHQWIRRGERVGGQRVPLEYRSRRSQTTNSCLGQTVVGDIISTSHVTVM